MLSVHNSPPDLEDSCKYIQCSEFIVLEHVNNIHIHLWVLAFYFITGKKCSVTVVSTMSSFQSDFLRKNKLLRYPSMQNPDPGAQMFSDPDPKNTFETFLTEWSEAFVLTCSFGISSVCVWVCLPHEWGLTEYRFSWNYESTSLVQRRSDVFVRMF